LGVTTRHLYKQAKKISLIIQDLGYSETIQPHSILYHDISVHGNNLPIAIAAAVMSPCRQAVTMLKRHNTDL